MPQSIYRVGAVFWLKDEMSGPLRGIRSRFEELKKSSPETARAIKEAGSDFAKAGALAAAAAAGFKLLSKGIALAREEAASKIKLTIAASYQGDTPAQIKARVADLRAYAFETSKDVKGNLGQIEEAFAQALNMGASPEKLKGGIGRYGALLADAMDMSKMSGLKIMNRTTDIFGISGPSDTAALADTIVQSKAVSGFSSGDQFAHEFARVSPAVARLGGEAKDAALLLAGVSKIREEGSGTATEAFFRELGAPGKKAKMQKWGLDEMFQGGKLVGPTKMDEIFTRFSARFRTEQERSAVLMELFGSEAQLLADAFANIDFGELERERNRKLTLDQTLVEQQKGLAYQTSAVGGTAESAGAALFGPAEEFLAKALQKTGAVLNPAFTAAINDESLQKGVSYTGMAAVAAAALGAGIYGAKGAGKIGGVLGGGNWKKVLFGQSLGAELAKAKALEKVAGVQPVSVVNVADFGKVGGLFGGGGTGPGGLVDEFGRPLASGTGRVAAAKAAAKGAGAGVSGGAGLAALAGGAVLVGAAYLAAKAIRDAANDAQEARARADASLALRGATADPATMLELIAGNRAARGAREGWSEERLAQEIAASIANYQEEARAPVQYEGFWKNWADGLNTIFKSAAEAATAQERAAKIQLEAAKVARVGQEVRITLDQNGTRTTRTLYRRGGEF